VVEDAWVGWAVYVTRDRVRKKYAILVWIPLFDFVESFQERDGMVAFTFMNEVVRIWP
jgi:hypothetical protein